MATSSNNTLKGVLVFGALTLGAAAFFVGPEDGKGLLAETAAQNASQEAAPAGPKVASKPTGMASTPEEEPVIEDLDWGEDSLSDNTEGFDPSPKIEGAIDPQPMDTTINDIDAADTYVEVVDTPQVGQRVPDHLRPR